MPDKDSQSHRAIIGQHVDRAIARGEIRPHEREHTIDVGVVGWAPREGNGRAAERAIKLVKDGLA